MISSCAIYSASDDNYIIPSIVALESIRVFHPEQRYFVIVNKSRISAKNISLLGDFGIQIIHFGEDCLFPDTKPWTMETFWKYKGPEVFFALGFAHSIYVDGDVLCVRPLDLHRLLPRIDGYAGIENQRPRKGNFKDPDFIRRKYGLSEEDLNGHNTNAGVIFWDNRKMVESKLFERVTQCFRECNRENPGMFRSVDQSVFALASILPPALPWLILPRGYNYRLGNVDDHKENVKEEDIRIYHFTGVKPWQPITSAGKLTQPWLLVPRYKWCKFVDEQAVFNRDLSITTRCVFTRIIRTLKYSLDDLMTVSLAKLLPFARKVKRAIHCEKDVSILRKD